MSDMGTGGERLALLSVPDDAALAGLDDDGLLEAVVSCERATAALAGLSCRASGLLAQRRHERALVQVGPDASTATVERETAEAEAAVVDEIRLASGLGLYDVEARVRLGRASTARAGRVRGRLAAGSCSWAMARVWHEATADLPADVADGIAGVVLGPTRDGATLSMALFRQRLNRQIAKHRTARQRRDFDLDRRDAFGTVTPHGTGEITVSGSAERVTAAIERVAGIARALRRMGDPRTQAQLRSDVLLDLVVFGDIPARADLPETPTVTPATTTPAAQEATAAAAPAEEGAAAATTATAASSTRPTGSATPASSPTPAHSTAATGTSSGAHRRTDGQGPTTGPHQATRSDSPNFPEGPTWPDWPAWSKPWESPRSAGSPPWPEWVRSFTGGLPPALIHVTVPLTALMELPGDNPEPGRLPTGEYLPAHLVRELAYAAGSTWQRLVTDPLTGEAIELSSTRYRPPPRLAAAVRLRDGTCRAPAALTPADRCDLDHDTPWHRGGSTCAGNLSAKARRAHQHKTCGQWTTRQHLDGSITWTTGTGRTYTTYPMQYDPTAPGRPELLDGPDCWRAESKDDVGDPDFIDPDQIDLADEIDHAELAGAELADHAYEEGPPIEYRDQGTATATRLATRPPGAPPPPPSPPSPPVHASRPDPGPPPF